jgi:hypothetical protein
MSTGMDDLSLLLVLNFQEQIFNGFGNNTKLDGFQLRITFHNSWK